MYDVNGGPVFGHTPERRWYEARRLGETVKVISFLLGSAFAIGPWVMVTSIGVAVEVVSTVVNSSVVILSWFVSRAASKVGTPGWGGAAFLLGLRLRRLGVLAVVGGVVVGFTAWALGGPWAFALGLLPPLLAVEPLVDGRRLARTGASLAIAGDDLSHLHTAYQRQIVSNRFLYGSLSFILGMTAATVIPLFWLMLGPSLVAALGAVPLGLLMMLSGVLRLVSAGPRVCSVLMGIVGVAGAATVFLLLASAAKKSMTSPDLTVGVAAVVALLVVFLTGLHLYQWPSCKGAVPGAST